MKCTTCNGTGSVPSDDDLKIAGEWAVAEARRLWRNDVYDPRTIDTSKDATISRAFIDAMIRGPLGLNWTWEPEYAGDGTFEWCGAFAARCWSKIKRDIRKICFASTYRLDRYARAASVMGETPVQPKSPRLLAELDTRTKRDALPFVPRAGDILLVGTKGYGQHICLIESYDEARGSFETIEGNANGRGPNGEKQQGVIRQTRYLGSIIGAATYHARRIIRPSVDDITG